jgi:hypothetical protein
MTAERCERPGPGSAGGLGEARSRLSALQDSAAAAYAAVTAADTELRAIAARRVAAERVLRRALLATGTGTAAGGQTSVADARRAVALLRDEFAARLAARSAAADALRRLTAQCAAARARISQDGPLGG